MDEQLKAHSRSLAGKIEEQSRSLAKNFEENDKKFEVEFPKFNGISASTWIKKCVKCFSLCKIPEEQKVDLASLCMTGKADVWASNYLSNKRIVKWSEFVMDLSDRFRATIGWDIEEKEFKKWDESFENYIIECERFLKKGMEHEEKSVVDVVMEKKEQDDVLIEEVDEFFGNYGYKDEVEVLSVKFEVLSKSCDKKEIMNSVEIIDIGVTHGTALQSALMDKEDQLCQTYQGPQFSGLKISEQCGSFDNTFENSWKMRPLPWRDKFVKSCLMNYVSVNWISAWGLGIYGPALLCGFVGSFGYLSVTKWKGIRMDKSFKAELVTDPRFFSYEGLTAATESRTEFLAEMSIRACLRHKNFVQFQGWCVGTGEMFLVYEFMPMRVLIMCCSKHLTKGQHYNVFHVSQLKKLYGDPPVTTVIPDWWLVKPCQVQADAEMVLVAILDKRMVKVQNKAQVQYLVQWEGVVDASWEVAENFVERNLHGMLALCVTEDADKWPTAAALPRFFQICDAFSTFMTSGRLQRWLQILSSVMAKDLRSSLLEGGKYDKGSQSPIKLKSKSVIILLFLYSVKWMIIYLHLVNI